MPLHRLGHSLLHSLLVGQPAPNLVFYFPLIKQNFSSWGGSRYWTMIASPVPDMQGGREQSVWFRFQQVRCEGAYLAPPCSLYGAPQYYDVPYHSPSNQIPWCLRPRLSIPFLCSLTA